MTLTDPRGGVVTNIYDSSGRITAQTDPDNHTTQYAYTGDNFSTTGGTTTITDPRGLVERQQYSNGFMNSVTKALGTSDEATWSYSYDGGSFATTKVTDPLGHITIPVYNYDGTLKSETDPDGRVTQYAYNSLGQVASVTTPANETSFSNHDARGNLTSTTDASSHVTTYNYGDAVHTGDLTSTDPDGNLTAYNYDGFNRMASATNALSKTTLYGYDKAGNRALMTDASGRTTHYGYDNADQLMSVTYSDGVTPNLSYTYDLDGHRKTMVDGTGTSTYTYDPAGRLKTVANGAGSNVGYSYDGAGNVTTITYPNGLNVTQTYDGEGNQTSLADWLGNTSTFAYDANGNLTNQTVPSPTPVADTYTYDNADQLASINTAAGASVLQHFDYTRDANARVKSAAPSGQPTTNYSYDPSGQLKQDIQGSYSYDAAGNPTQIITSDALTYDAGNELRQVGTGPSATTYAYTAQGERLSSTTSGDSTNYGYDQAGRLTSYISGGTSASYTYNGDGLRASKTVGATTTAFTWSTQPDLPLLLVDGTTSYIYGPDGLPIEAIPSGGSPSYLHHDQQGSTTLVTSSTGVVTSTLTYGSFGQLRSGTPSVSLLYDGQYLDGESGLYYLRARYYEPSTAQFLTVDPVLEQTRAPYSYGGNDPVNAGDPSGMWGWSSITSHWRGIAQFAVAATVVIGCAGFTVTTAGLGAIACGAIGGALSGAFNYATNGASSHNLAGYAFNGGVGAVLGGIGGWFGTGSALRIAGNFTTAVANPLITGDPAHARAPSWSYAAHGSGGGKAARTAPALSC